MSLMGFYIRSKHCMNQFSALQYTVLTVVLDSVTHFDALRRILIYCYIIACRLNSVTGWSQLYLKSSPACVQSC